MCSDRAGGNVIIVIDNFKLVKKVNMIVWTWLNHSYVLIRQAHAKAVIVYCPWSVVMGCCKGTKNASVLTEPLVGWL